MKILKIEKSDLPSVIDFLSPYESSCVQLCSNVRKASTSLYALTTTDTILTPNILGIVFADSTIFHCIPPQFFQFIDIPALRAFFRSLKKPVKCITGEANATKLLSSCLETSPYQLNSYKLMTASVIQNPPEPLYNDDQIIRCTVNDIEALLPIQTMYFQEEVAPAGKQVSEAEVSLGLRQLLKNQLCVALSSDGELVAKANTNAIGFNWIQIGGVFTHPLYRRNNYAWHLVSAICRRVFSSGKAICLFVKTSNIPAISLYTKLGFSTVRDFLIAYFK